MSTNFQTPPPRPGSSGLDLVSPLLANVGWIKFYAIVQLVGACLGVLGSLGIYIIVLWIPIWLSIVLLQAASQLDRARMSGDDQAIRTAMGKLGFFFKLQGIFTIIGIGLAIFGIIIALVIGLSLPHSF